MTWVLFILRCKQSKIHSVVAVAVRTINIVLDGTRDLSSPKLPYHLRKGMLCLAPEPFEKPLQNLNTIFYEHTMTLYLVESGLANVLILVVLICSYII